MTQTYLSEKERLLMICQDNGDFVCGDDGFIVYFPTSMNSGALSAWELRIIADELDRRNASWQEIMDNHFQQESKVNVLDSN